MKRKNIVLCGFMGSGKSTIGNLLSKKMGIAFIDLDAYIEKKENKSGNADNKIILLDLPVEVVEQRLQGDTKRPLLNRPDKEKVMRELYEKRLPLYRNAADIVVNAANSPMQVCMEIMANL